LYVELFDLLIASNKLTYLLIYHNTTCNCISCVATVCIRWKRALRRGRSYC